MSDDIQVTNDDSVVIDTPMEDDDHTQLEDDARHDGWVPREEYRGDPERWVDAAEFVERGKHINKILQSKNKRLEDEIANLRTGVEQFKKFSQERHAAQIKEKEDEVSILKAQRAAAIREGDGERVEELSDRIDAAKDAQRELSIKQQQDVEQPRQQEDPIFVDWKAKNRWYDDNPEAQTEANKYATELRQGGETRTGRAFLRMIDEYMKEEMPNLYSNPNRSRPGAVASGKVGNSGGVSVEAFARTLPREDYDFMELGIREGWFKDRADFMKQYKEI